MICRLALVALLPSLLPAAVHKDEKAAGKFAASFAAIAQRREYAHTSWGIAIGDLASGKLLYGLSEAKMFVPASNTKLFSVAAALLALGPDYRFVTPLYLTAARNPDGLVDGSLVLKASGDPNLSGRIDAAGNLALTDHDHIYADGSDDSEAAPPPADPVSGLNDLATQVVAAGVKQVRDVQIDTRLFEKAEGSGSGPSQLVPIVVNDNLIDVTAAPGSAPGQPATVILRPVSTYAQFDVRVSTIAAGGHSNLSVQQVAPAKFAVRGQVAIGRAPLLAIAEVSDPAAFARSLLIECLEAHGVTVERSGLAPPNDDSVPADYAGLTVVARHTSPPLAQEAKVILKVSHNLGASLLPLLLAVKQGQRTLAAGMKIQGETLHRLGVDVDALSFAGGAGGSRADYVTPAAVVQLLTLMSRQSCAEVYRDAMPVLGVDGSLVKAIGPESPARGKVFAKTGTLDWDNLMEDRVLLTSKALGGYVTASSGRQLAFGLYLNNVSVKTSADVEAQGRVLGSIAELIWQSF